MLPEVQSDLSEEYEIEREPSLTWKLGDGGSRIIGKVDGAKAVQQAIYCILNTERYESMIYSWDYGVELSDLFGEPLSYVLPELKRRVSEALTQDERITGVKDFSFVIEKKGVVNMAFTAETIYGEVRGKKEVHM